MIRWFTYGLLLFATFTSCKQAEKSDSTPNLAEEGDIPSDFLQFYMRFHSDSLFQLNHIDFPIDRKKENEQWTIDNWKMHTAFDDMGGQFQQTFKNFNGLIIEYVRDQSGAFSLEKRFVKSSEGYKLMYYHVINAFEGSEEWKEE